MAGYGLYGQIIQILDQDSSIFPALVYPAADPIGPVFNENERPGGRITFIGIIDGKLQAGVSGCLAIAVVAVAAIGLVYPLGRGCAGIAATLLLTLGTFVSAGVGIRACRLRAGVSFRVLVNTEIISQCNCRAAILQMEIFIPGGDVCKLRIINNCVCSENGNRNMI